MKIVGGKFKNRNFYIPAGIRPTQSITRKAVFDLIGQDISGLTFLDLFAGSGAMGLEALSRGAAKVIFVEKDAKCAGVIEENLRLFGLERTFQEFADYDLISMDAFAAIKHLARREQAFDIIFIDPPYSRGHVKKALKTLGAYDIMKPDSLMIIEHSKREPLPQDLDGRFFMTKHRHYGLAHLALYQSRQIR